MLCWMRDLFKLNILAKYHRSSAEDASPTSSTNDCGKLCATLHTKGLTIWRKTYRRLHSTLVSKYCAPQYGDI